MLLQQALAGGISREFFKGLANETLKTYIRSRRLANALDKLLLTKEKIIDIAMEAGFESQESFTRAFKSSFNVTPNEYRKLGNKGLFLKKLEFSAEYLEHINTSLSLVPEIYTQKSMRLVGLKTLFYGVDSEKNNIAERLPVLWAEFLARIGEIENTKKGICYGVVQQLKNSSDLLEYYAAIDVSSVRRFQREWRS